MANFLVRTSVGQNNRARRTLMLEFGQAFCALGCANGVSLRYVVRRIAHGQWELETTADDLMRTREFTTERAAKQAARRDFHRRQLLTLAA